MNEGIIFERKPDLTPTARGLILIESLDKFANVSLANNTAVIVNTLPKDVQYKTLTTSKNIVEGITKDKPSNVSKKIDVVIRADQIKIIRKYFHLWKTTIKQKRQHIDKREKIDTFIEQLKRHKESKCESDNYSVENDKNHLKNYVKCNRNRFKDASEVYENRYKAQQDLIRNQKLKLQRQEKMIEDLKLGIIVEETEKSLENSKYDVREIFKRCSEKVKCKITPLEVVETNEHIIELRSSKAPKIIAQMEKRAAEREMRRNIILLKKKLMDEEKRKQTENAIEQKRALDEEQKQKSLEAIKERRRLENELEKKRQENKLKYLQSINKANRFYRRKMKQKLFTGFKKLLEMKTEYEVRSELFYIKLLQRKSLNQWLVFVKEKIENDNFEADCLYGYRLRKRVLKAWHSVLILRKQSMQVAEDLYDMKVQSKMFIEWHRFICKQQVIEYKNLEIAKKHYRSRILLQFFYQWKSLPAVLQLEKAKEEKKRKWREKVWEIIPDYQPYTEVI